MSLLLTLVATAVLAAAPEAEGADAACSQERMAYGPGVAQMWSPVCTQACEGYPEGCMDRCMGPQNDRSDADFRANEAACDQAGGMLLARMPACERALGKMLELRPDSDVGTALGVVDLIYRACSVEQLCDVVD